MRIQLACVLALVALALAGCGEDGTSAAEPAATGRWSHARLVGVARATALASLEGRLLVATSGSRELRVVEVSDVVEGADVQSLVLPLEVDPDLFVGGSDTLAAQGYQVGDLWAQDLDVQGLAANAPNFVFLAEHSYRVMYMGRIYQNPDRSWRALKIERVFTLPGADRKDASSSDWRDKGPGVTGLAAVKGERRTGDLYVVDEGDPETGTFRLFELDRFGLALKKFTVDLEAGVEPLVGGILREDKRQVVVRGPGRGTLHGVRDATRNATVRAARGVPGPDLEGVVRWSGMARSPDGTWWMVSAGNPAILAWRRP